MKNGVSDSVHAKKSLGQHYLINRDISRKIVALLDQDENDNILEIGPGPGALSEYLFKAPHKQLIMLEKDFHWARARADDCGKNERVLLMDALDFSWQKLNHEWKLIGNLPYNIASPLLWNIVCEARIKKAVFMVQLEVARRIVAKPGTKEYGALSVWIQNFMTPKLEFKIAPGSFRPAPKVDSAIFSLVPAFGQKPEKPQVLASLLHICFQNRRKQLGGIFRRNGLDHLLSDLDSLGLAPEARPENLSPAQFAHLARCMPQ